MDAATRQQQLQARMAPNNYAVQPQQQQPSMAAPSSHSQSAHAPSRSSSSATAPHAAAPAGYSSSSSSSMSSEHARSFQSSFESFCALLDQQVRQCAVDDVPTSKQQQIQQQHSAADAKENAARLFTAYTQLEMQTDRIAIYLVRSVHAHHGGRWGGMAKRRRESAVETAGLRVQCLYLTALRRECCAVCGCDSPCICVVQAECERKLLLEMHEPLVTQEQVSRAQHAHAVAQTPPPMPAATDTITNQRGAFVRAQLDALLKRAQVADAEAGAVGRDDDATASSQLNGSDVHASQTSTVAFATPVSSSPSGALLTPNGLMSPHSSVHALSHSLLTPNSAPGHSPNDSAMAASPATMPMDT